MSPGRLHRIGTPVMVGALIALLAACGTDVGEGRDDPEPDGIGMSAQPATVPPGADVRLTIRNETGSTVTYGAAYELEREVDGEWEEVPLDMAFIQILLILRSEESTTDLVTLPDDLEPGPHRIVKTFDLPGPDEADPPARVRATAEIEVVES